MEYHGKLYGKIGNKYFDTSVTSDDYDNLVAHNKLFIDKIKDLEAKLKAAESVNEWISVEDRLPDNRGIVIICWEHNNNKKVTSGSYNAGGNYWQHANWTQLKVTHWMPLPTNPI